jgi:hypothetical protein
MLRRRQQRPDFVKEFTDKKKWISRFTERSPEDEQAKKSAFHTARARVWAGSEPTSPRGGGGSWTVSPATTRASTKHTTLLQPVPFTCQPSRGSTPYH